MSGYPMKVVELLAGENQQFDRLVGGAMCLSTAIMTAEGLITASPCLLYGYVIHAQTTVGALAIKNGTSTGGGMTRITIPVGKAVGEYIFPVAIDCPAGLYLTFGSGATASISILYLPVT